MIKVDSDSDTDFILSSNDLSGISEAAENPYGEDDAKSPFPVQPQVKRSYAQNVTVWIKASGLQVQKDTVCKGFFVCCGLWRNGTNLIQYVVSWSLLNVISDQR